MKKEDMFVERIENFIVAGIEGDAPDIREGLESYLKKGELKEMADFSPVMPKSGGPNAHWFLVGNIYQPDVCTMTVCQYIHADYHKPSTSIVCAGIGDLTLGLISDFAKNINLKPYKPSDEFIKEILIGQSPLYFLYKSTKDLGEEIQKPLFAASFRTMQEIYRASAMAMNADLN